MSCDRCSLAADRVPDHRLRLCCSGREQRLWLAACMLAVDKVANSVRSQSLVPWERNLVI